MNRILVFGGTGNVGSQVLAHLRSQRAHVRAVVRNPEGARVPAGVEVVRGDLTSPESLDPCLDGIDTVFLVWTAPPAAVAPALDRITRHTRRIVLLTSPHKTPHPFFQQPNPVRVLHAELERRIESSGGEWTFLRPGMLASNSRLWWAPQMQAGDVVRWPYLAVPTAPIDERDIARVAVRALCDDGHAGAEYVLTGPESLTQFEQVATIGRAIGRTLRIEELSPDDAMRELTPLGPPFIVKMLLDAWAAGLGQPAYVTSTVAEITGAPARRFAEWAADHVSDFRAPAVHQSA